MEKNDYSAVSAHIFHVFNDIQTATLKCYEWMRNMCTPISAIWEYTCSKHYLDW